MNNVYKMFITGYNRVSQSQSQKKINLPYLRPVDFKYAHSNLGNELQ